MINPQQRAFLVQCQSDWAVFQLLRSIPEIPPCQSLHYLQMCTEKLAKAYFWQFPAADVGHAAFLRFVLALKKISSEPFRSTLGIVRKEHYRAFITSMGKFAAEAERLSPSHPGDMPNTEYPWPRELPTIAPVQYNFALHDQLSHEGGRKFLRFLGLLIVNFESLFG